MDRKLIDYLPNVMKDVKEITAILQAEQPEFITVWTAAEAALNDQFINSATENGVNRWEKILNIVPKASDTLDTRKFRILTRLNEQLPYTYKSLSYQLENLCGKDNYFLQINNAAYTLVVKIAVVAKNSFDDVYDLLKRIAPANIFIDLKQLYNTHNDLNSLKHVHLKLYTYNDLRNEVIK